jgi:hypothetical protein
MSITAFHPTMISIYFFLTGLFQPDLSWFFAILSRAGVRLGTVAIFVLHASYVIAGKCMGEAGAKGGSTRSPWKLPSYSRDPR